MKTAHDQTSGEHEMMTHPISHQNYPSLLLFVKRYAFILAVLWTVIIFMMFGRHLFEVYEKTQQLPTRNQVVVEAMVYFVLWTLGLGGLALGVSYLWRGIRERDRIQEALRKSEEWFEGIFENMKCGVAVYDAVHDGEDFIIVDFNPAAERIEKVDKEDVIGKRVTEAFPGVEDFGLLNVLRRVWQTSKPEFVPANLYEDERNSGWRENYVYRLTSGYVFAVFEDVTDRRRSDEKLRESLSRQESILQNLQAGIMIIDPETHVIVEVNPAAATLIGAPIEEITGKVCHDFVCPNARGACPVTDKGITVDCRDCILLTNSKDQRHVMKTVTTIMLDGKPHLLESFVDLSDRIKAENNLRDSEQKMRAITSAAQDAIVMMDHEGKVAFWNKAAERIFGWSWEEITNRKVHEVLTPERLRDAHYKAFPAFQMTGEGAAVGKTIQLPALRKDGTEIPIDLSLSAFQLDGKWCSIGMARDISERVENEQSQARLKSAIEAASETIVIIDTDGVIQYVNPQFERTTGYTCEEAIGANPRLLNSGEHDESFYKDLWETILAGETWNGRFTNKAKDGTLFYEDATISPIMNESGEIINYVAVKRDVTRQKELEGQLQQAQKLESIGQLAAGIAHEINTPIQYVGDNTRFVRESVEELMAIISRCGELVDLNAPKERWQERADEFRRMIEEIDLEFIKEEIPTAIEQTLDGVDRVAEIVLAMKDFSHPGGEEKTPIDLNKAINSTITVCRNRWKYVADLETDFQADLPMVPCLVGEFNQVVLNIVVNAADAIGENVSEGDDRKGQIKVSTRRDGESVEIRVCDTGGGIPEEIQQKVFDPFFTTKDVGKGTGQGLAISHDVIVNKHGGTLRLETEPGIGTTFIIRLPIATESTQPQQEAA